MTNEHTPVAKWKRINEKTHRLRLPALAVDLNDMGNGQYFYVAQSIWDHLEYSDHRYLKAESLQDAKNKAMKTLHKDLLGISNTVVVNARHLDILLLEQEDAPDKERHEAIIRFKKEHLLDDREYAVKDIVSMLKDDDQDS